MREKSLTLNLKHYKLKSQRDREKGRDVPREKKMREIESNG